MPAYVTGIIRDTFKMIKVDSAVKTGVVHVVVSVRLHVTNPA